MLIICRGGLWPSATHIAARNGEPPEAAHTRIFQCKLPTTWRGQNLMPNHEQLSALAKACGFTHCAPLDVKTLEFLPEVHQMCAANTCGRYNKSWACPPAVGTLEEMRARVKGYAAGLLVQTVGEIEDSYDWDGIQSVAKRQGENFAKLWDELEKIYPSVLAMGTGGCTKCEKCAYPDEPCRFPERMAASMEACGLYVSKLCADNGLAYNYGPEKIAFTACFLL